MAHGSIRAWGQWVILDESVEGRWACPGTLGVFLKCLRGPRVSRASQGPEIHYPGGLDGVGSPEGLRRGWATKEAQDKLTVASWDWGGILRNWAQVTPGGLGGFARPGPLRTVPRPLEHGHLVPGSRWPPLLPLRGDSRPALVSPLGQEKRLASPAPLPGGVPGDGVGLSQTWAQPPGGCQGFSQCGPCAHKMQIPGFSPNLGVCTF